MKSLMYLSIAVFLISIAGCGESTPTKSKATTSPATSPSKADAGSQAKADDEAEIKSSLAKLNAEDRKLAEEQKFCAVMTDSRLGSMGAPIKLMIKDEAVFICCKSCQKKALADPEKTLATLKSLKK